jgi:putative ABC transport system permease protein
MASLLRDFRYALRLLLRNPGVAVIAVLALALGIGVNTSCFITVSSVVLHPLPYPDQGRIMTLWEANPRAGATREPVAPANFRDWQEQSRSFSHLAAYRRWDASLTGNGDPERIQACRVTPSLFPLLAIKPVAGRTFTKDEDQPARDAVAVVSYGFWRRHLAASPEAIGRTLSLNDRTYTIVGIMPDDFDFPLATEVWTPLALPPEEAHQRGDHNLAVLARLAPGVTLVQARSDMDAIAGRLARQFPLTNESRTVSVIPLRELTNEVTDRFVLTLLGAAGFVLLLACANVANLQLARATARQKEVAIRTAVGARRPSIVRQLLAENILVALIGGALGLFLASWNLDLTRAIIPPLVYRIVAGLRTMGINAEVVWFTLAVSIAAGILVSLPTLLHLLRPKAIAELNQSLKEGGRGAGVSSGNRLRGALVVVEVSLALVLLVGAGLMVSTFQRLLDRNPGFNPKNLLTMQLALPAHKYTDSRQVEAFYDRVLTNLEALPEVKAAGVSGYLGNAAGLRIEGRPEPRPGEPRPQVWTATPDHFRALELPLVSGRSISRQDTADSLPVVVLNQSLARHYWPDSDPNGNRIQLDGPRSPWLTVIGVCGDTRDWFRNQPMPIAYRPHSQVYQPSFQIVVRTAADPLLLASAARAAIREVDKAQPVYDLKSMEQVLAEQTSGIRASAISMTTYAVIALILAATGIYAVLSYSVARRTQEIGVRMALGAADRDVLKMVMSQASRMAGLGLAIGLVNAWLLTRLMASVLYDVVTLEPLAFTAFTAVLAAAAFLAAYIPARRAARVDALIALHHE